MNRVAPKSPDDRVAAPGPSLAELPAASSGSRSPVARENTGCIPVVA